MKEIWQREISFYVKDWENKTNINALNQKIFWNKITSKARKSKDQMSLPVILNGSCCVYVKAHYTYADVGEKYNGGYNASISVQPIFDHIFTHTVTKKYGKFHELVQERMEYYDISHNYW